MTIGRRDLISLFGLATLASAIKPISLYGKGKSALNTESEFSGLVVNSHKINVPSGSTRISSGYTFSGQRHNIVGDGPNVSVLVFDAPAYGPAITLYTPEKGGQYQSSIRDIGFFSSSVIEKVAISLVNVANINIERVAIPDGGWQGPMSVGIKAQGRQFIRIRDCDISCAHPVVIGSNPIINSLAADYLNVTSCELNCTSKDGAAFEVQSAAIMSNLTIRDTALIGGSAGFRYLDDSAPISPNTNIQFENIRIEQGATQNGWSFNLESKNNSIQSLLFTNVRMDNSRNGIRVRNVQRLTLVNCDFDQVGERVLLDMLGVPGSVLTMINCWGQSGGRVNIRKMRRLQGAGDDIGGLISPFEIWVYDDKVA